MSPAPGAKRGNLYAQKKPAERKSRMLNCAVTDQIYKKITAAAKADDSTLPAYLRKIIDSHLGTFNAQKTHTRTDTKSDTQ